jgi:hypothetical protein
MKKIPLFGAGTKGRYPTVTAQRRLNCIFEQRADGDMNTYAVYGTPGEALFSDLLPMPARGAYQMGAYAYAVSGSDLYQINSFGAGSIIGSLSILSSGPVSITDNGRQLLIVDGVGGYIYDTVTAVFATIVDANFPNGATSCAFLGGYFVVNVPNTGQFRVSQSYDGLNWTPLIFATAESNPDNLLEVNVDHGMLILSGAKTTEFWVLSGALDVPFAPSTSSTDQYGLLAQQSMVKFADSMAFLGINQQGQMQVCLLQGTTVQRISDSDIESIINDFSVVTDAVALAYEIRGHPVYQITFQNEMRSFLYDYTTTLWSEVQTGVAETARHNGQYCITLGTDHLVTDYSNGNIYRYDTNVFTDNGTAIKRLLQTRHLDFGGNYFGIDELYLSMETGVGLASGQGSDPQIAMSVSKDGGRTWGNERWTSLGRVGQYEGPRVIWRRCGGSRVKNFRVFMTDPVPFSMTYGSISVRDGHG